MQFSCHLKHCLIKKQMQKTPSIQLIQVFMLSKINVNLILTLNELHLKLIYLELIFIIYTTESRMTVD
jgi:hypothetical protein